MEQPFHIHSATCESPCLSTTSRLQKLIEAYHEKIFNIDQLERKVDAKALQIRRRITNHLENQPPPSQRASVHSYRSSHLRIFVTHKLVQRPIKPPPTPTPDTEILPILVTPDPPPPEYKLQIEGKLLVGHLDHESAAAFDRRTGYTNSNNAPTSDDSLDRNRGEQLHQQQQEEEEPHVLTSARHCTHFFTKVVVTLEPLYMHKPNPMSKKVIIKTMMQPQPQLPQPLPPLPQNKKSRRGGASSSSSSIQNPSSSSSSSSSSFMMYEEKIDPALLTRGIMTKHEWTRSMTSDAHLWCFHYKMPHPPGYHLMPHSVLAKIQLFSARPDNDLWLPNNNTIPAVGKVFPTFVMTVEDPTTLAAAAAATKSKKRKLEELSSEAVTMSTLSSSASTSNARAPISTSARASPVDESSSHPSSPLVLENSIYIPQGLTMKEVCLAFFTYIRDRDLCDESDKSIIICDDTLRQIFDVDRFAFSQLQSLISSRGLLRNISNEPIELAYVLKPETALPDHERQLTKAEHNALHYSFLQFDIDVAVPNLFPVRYRELLRRIKRRELDYMSSRTKARSLLLSRRAKDEDTVKVVIDEVVAKDAINDDLQPVLAAIAKSCSPNSEARMASHISMRMGYLTERAREQLQLSRGAWGVVDSVIASFGSTSSTEKETQDDISGATAS